MTKLRSLSAVSGSVSFIISGVKTDFFCQNIIFFIFILSKKFYFVQKILFCPKIFIFSKNFYFFQKFLFFPKIFILSKKFYFVQKFLFCPKFWFRIFVIKNIFSAIQNHCVPKKFTKNIRYKSSKISILVIICLPIFVLLLVKIQMFG